MLNWLRQLSARVTGHFGNRFRAIRARFDAAQTTAENRRHWAHADQLSANAAASPEVRRILRSRARYEVANNSYAKGIVGTLADYIVGTGPRLQMLTDDPATNRLVEQEFARWATAIGLAHKLRTMRISQCESGECFALLTTNPCVAAPVQLDLRLFEADQVASPVWSPQSGVRSSGPRSQDSRLIDGIMFDAFDNPVAYTILRHHPGDNATCRGGDDDYDLYPSSAVVHLYRAERPGQSRGVPEITPALPLFAMLRRYTLAVLGAAEQAALPSGVIYTDAPADAEAAGVEPMDEVEMERGTWLTMPYGWKVNQVRAEQPTTVYGDFKREIINEIARCLEIPLNIALGNSAKHNYASGRLDHQAFFKKIKIDQAYLGSVVLDRVLRAWIEEAVQVTGYLPQSLRTRSAEFPHQWFWDGFEHVDPAKEANAQLMRLASNTTTLAAEYAKAGLDWECELRQRGREAALMRELGLDEAGVRRPEAGAEEEADSKSRKEEV